MIFEIYYYLFKFISIMPSEIISHKQNDTETSSFFNQKLEWSSNSYQNISNLSSSSLYKSKIPSEILLNY